LAQKQIRKPKKKREKKSKKRKPNSSPSAAFFFSLSAHFNQKLELSQQIFPVHSKQSEETERERGRKGEWL